ncbi:MAG TPA: beta-ketoacyl synthase N-terminal-like domain-containing protein [Candidatus Eisenbacteria bacterium]|nr:beta-ketoacyl synthase N-terminal-like domain-containing protein [Candidatus Eisenbacteria bacterium]
MTGEIAITGVGGVHAPDPEAMPEVVRARAARAERVTQLVIGAAGAALAMAGLDVTAGDPRPEVGVVLGTALGCFLTNVAYQRRFVDGGAAAASPRLFAATVSNAAAGELAIAYRLGGPAITLTAGGVAGLVAIGHAVDLLRLRQADAFVAGGMDAAGEPLERWIADGGLALDGPVGEGAATLVLEPVDHARARGARVLGIVRDAAAGFEPGAAAARAPSALAAAGVFEILAALKDGAPRTTHVLGRCPSGHVASIVVERSA